MWFDREPRTGRHVRTAGNDIAHSGVVRGRKREPDSWCRHRCRHDHSQTTGSLTRSERCDFDPRSVSLRRFRGIVMKKDHYKVLEIARDASAEDIQHAYRTLALLYHPDRNSAPEAAARMTAINEAWEVLGNPRRRSEYDALLVKPAAHPEFA